MRTVYRLVVSNVEPSMPSLPCFSAGTECAQTLCSEFEMEQLFVFNSQGMLWVFTEQLRTMRNTFRVLSIYVDGNMLGSSVRQERRVVSVFSCFFFKVRHDCREERLLTFRDVSAGSDPSQL